MKAWDLKSFGLVEPSSQLELEQKFEFSWVWILFIFSFPIYFNTLFLLLLFITISKFSNIKSQSSITNALLYIVVGVVWVSFNYNHGSLDGRMYSYEQLFSIDRIEGWCKLIVLMLELNVSFQLWFSFLHFLSSHKWSLIVSG